MTIKKDELKRQLRFWDSVAINVGIVIGVGIFRVPSTIARYLDSPSLILTAWLVGGLIALLGVFCYAELASNFPETGGTYIFLREAYGKFVGFLYGWAEFSINRAATIAAVAYVFSTYLQNLIPFGVQNEKWVALSAIAVFTCVNMFGVHFGIKAQHVLSFFKIFAIMAISFVIFYFSKSVTSPALRTTSHHPVQFATALIPILWTYGGWHESTFMSGEFHDTRRELPISLILGALLVTGLYVFINAAYLHVISPAEMVQSKAVASDALMKVFGSTGGIVMTVAILISSSGALNSNILTGGRIPFSVAQDAQRLAWFGKVDDRFGTPLRSIALNGVWASVLVLWGNFEQILFFNSFQIWLFFILVGASVFLLRRKHTQEKNYLMIGYPLVPIMFTFVSVWLCWTTIQSAPREALFGVLIISAGVPVYFLTRGTSTSPYKSIV